MGCVIPAKNHPGSELPEDRAASSCSTVLNPRAAKDSACRAQGNKKSPGTSGLLTYAASRCSRRGITKSAIWFGPINGRSGYFSVRSRSVSALRRLSATRLTTRLPSSDFRRREGFEGIVACLLWFIWSPTLLRVLSSYRVGCKCSVTCVIYEMEHCASPKIDRQLLRCARTSAKFVPPPRSSARRPQPTFTNLGQETKLEVFSGELQRGHAIQFVVSLEALCCLIFESCSYCFFY